MKILSKPKKGKIKNVFNKKILKILKTKLPDQSQKRIFETFENFENEKTKKIPDQSQKRNFWDDEFENLKKKDKNLH